MYQHLIAFPQALWTSWLTKLLSPKTLPRHPHIMDLPRTKWIRGGPPCMRPVSCDLFLCPHKVLLHDIILDLETAITAKEASLLANQTIRYPGTELFQTQVDVFHQLHCLVSSVSSNYHASANCALLNHQSTIRTSCASSFGPNGIQKPRRIDMLSVRGKSSAWQIIAFKCFARA